MLTGSQAPYAGNEDRGSQDGGNNEPAGPDGGLTAEAAEETVQRVYETAESEEYGTSYDLLSQNFRATENVSEAGWADTFSELQSIDFVEGPDADVSGDTATVSGVTRAELTGQTERNTATWTLVNEGGEWKMDTITIENQEIL